MTLGPDGSATAQALKAKADAIPIVKRARDIVGNQLSPWLNPVATARLRLRRKVLSILNIDRLKKVLNRRSYRSKIAD